MFLLFCFVGNRFAWWSIFDFAACENDPSGFAVRALLEVRRDFLKKLSKKEEKREKIPYFLRKRKILFSVVGF